MPEVSPAAALIPLEYNRLWGHDGQNCTVANVAIAIVCREFVVFTLSTVHTQKSWVSIVALFTFSPLGPAGPGEPSVPGKPGKPYNPKHLIQMSFIRVNTVTETVW